MHTIRKLTDEQKATVDKFMQENIFTENSFFEQKFYRFDCEREYECVHEYAKLFTAKFGREFTAKRAKTFSFDVAFGFCVYNVKANRRDMTATRVS